MNIEAIAAAALYLYNSFQNNVDTHYKKAIRKPWRKRRWWMLSVHRNRTKETMENLFAELLAEPSGDFFNFLRMSASDFEYLICKISPIVVKQDTDWRKAIPVKTRLGVTLRFLATGDSFRSLHYLFKISSQSISKIVPEVCIALIEVLKDLVKMPSTIEEWLSKARGFRFPHCVGAMDGKHISILPPSHTGSEYYNYKGGFSIVLLALVDSDYCFTFADIGSQGRISDGGVFNQSVLQEKLRTNSLNLPPPTDIPGSRNSTNLPYVFLADGAFALHGHIMKPFSGHHALGTPERLFNQQLSSSRVVVENTFGIISSVFRVFKRAIPLEPAKAATITMTCVLLHNFLRKSTTSRISYTPDGASDTYVNGQLVHAGSWRNENSGAAFFPLQSVPRRGPDNAIQTRLNFVNYFYQNRV